MKFNRKNISDKQLLKLYEAILLPRMIEEKMMILLRQGKISKWFSGMGQEAIPAGVAAAMAKEEYILPMHRNLAVFTYRGVPLGRLFAQFQGKPGGFTKGRDRSFHFGSNEHHIVGMISHLGAQLGIADGIALASKISKEGRATVVFTGDGGASEGDFHEAMNVAAVWDLPVIVVVENNGYGLSTPSAQQFRKDFRQKAEAYGMESTQMDGNNILDVYSTMKKAVSRVRKTQKPMLVEALTFRMRGHEEASGNKYVPKELLEFWAKKDPVENYEGYLLEQHILTDDIQVEIKHRLMKQIEVGLEEAFSESQPEADTKLEISDVFVPYKQKIIKPYNDKKSSKRLVDALSDALRSSMERYPDMVFMGQDVADYGGVFKVTEGFLEQFGSDRIRNTPICESAIIGVGLGLSIKNRKSIIEMQFADFVSCGFNQIINNLAKIHYRWGQNADVVIRMPTGAGVGAGPFHSQSNEAWFFHTPGLKIVYPSSPYDAKGLLAAAIEDPNPVMVFEHKMLYRSISEDIPDDYYTIEIGKAHLVEEGEDLSIITYGAGVHWALEMVNSDENISADILDLRSLMPWDMDAVKTTIQKTGKALILHEDTLTGGIGGEISAWISEKCFEFLDGPVMRVGSLDTPVPFSSPLEQNFLAKSRLKDKVKELLEF
jgi:2-oxoisovalerate dehydrogenase E1 component